MLNETYSCADDVVMEMDRVGMDLGVETKNYPAISLTFVVNILEGVSLG